MFFLSDESPTRNLIVPYIMPVKIIHFVFVVWLSVSCINMKCWSENSAAPSTVSTVFDYVFLIILRAAGCSLLQHLIEFHFNSQVFFFFLILRVLSGEAAERVTEVSLSKQWRAQAPVVLLTLWVVQKTKLCVPEHSNEFLCCCCAFNSTKQLSTGLWKKRKRSDDGAYVRVFCSEPFVTLMWR